MADADQNKKQKTAHTPSNGNENGSARTPSNKMPETYPYIDESVTDDHRQQRLGHDGIITDCKPDQCEGGFDFYMDEEVCFDGKWKAVWTSRHLGCDVLVMVKKKCFPNAIVELVEPFCCNHPNSFADYALDGSGHKSKTKEDVTKFLSSKQNKVPLLELLPVKDNDEEDDDDKDDDKEDEEEDEEDIDIDQIAEILELYRFFYAYMWRVIYDENEGGQYMFQCPAMFYRGKLHYDVKNKKTTQAIIDSYNETMKEYQKKAWQFNALRDDYKNPNRDKELPKMGRQVMKLEKTLEKLNKQNQKR